ncbi:hypothetical protein ABID22_001030 [Pontibacter aydingkolensis]|uniref:Uncharacterized protein n=1 Tax=Pontibacter aydingkolensis TaxID=1911536 RepID=A0ABS7CSZ7_9BACT|nr:hypothetical protein [Pontibacter aydingkolensis]MBW7466940.1 hypothetical protein [Pontibacter aydingkolensis]
MKKLLTATLTLVALLVVTTQASAQVAAFNSLSLHFSNSILTTAQYHQVLESAKSGNKNTNEITAVTKQHLSALPTTGYVFGDNTESKPITILGEATLEAEPMDTALENWITKKLAMQHPKYRGKQ